MNKIVREHYPASRLPADLREAIGENEQVTVTIVVETSPAADEPSDGKSWFQRHKNIQRDYFQTTEEINDYVRSLRDEWSHRER